MATKNNRQKLKLIINFKDNKVTRLFSNNLLQTQAGAEFTALFDKKPDIINQVFHALNEIYGKKEAYKTPALAFKVDDALKILLTEQKVPWYHSEFFLKIKEICKNHNHDFDYFNIRVKACKEYYLYLLEGKHRSRGLELIHDPFFRPAPPPLGRNDEENFRGLVDTLLFTAGMLKNVKDTACPVSGYIHGPF